MEEIASLIKYKTVIQTVPVFNAGVMRNIILNWEKMSIEELAVVFKAMHDKLYELNRAMIYFKNVNKSL